MSMTVESRRNSDRRLYNSKNKHKNNEYSIVYLNIKGFKIVQGKYEILKYKIPSGLLTYSSVSLWLRLFFVAHIYILLQNMVSRLNFFIGYCAFQNITLHLLLLFLVPYSLKKYKQK